MDEVFYGMYPQLMCLKKKKKKNAHSDCLPQKGNAVGVF